MTKPTDTEIATTCNKCKRQFWTSIATTPTSTTCPDCYTSDHSLLRVANMGMAALEKTEGFHGLADLANELKTLGAPIEKRFWGPSLEDQLARKRDSAKRVTKIARQRSRMLASLAQLATSISTVRTAELDGRLQLLTKQRDLLQLQRQVRELEDEMRTGKVASDHQLADSHDQALDEASHRRARLERRQAEATEFLNEVDRAYKSSRSAQERRLHIRLALEAFDGEPADLPEDVRQFLSEE